MKSAPEQPLNLILLGDPASGKGTQAERLAGKYRFYNLDMGKEVRKPAVRAQYDYEKTTALGHLTPTVVVRNIFKQVIVATPTRQGILFNGTPKMINEAKLVARLLRESRRGDPLVIYINIPASEMFKRAGLRREYVHGRPVKRDDDSARALRNRQRYYRGQISRVVAFFGQRYTVKRISGVGTEAAVEKKIEAAIAKYINDMRIQHGKKNPGRN
jgi:adenylate kinase